MKVLIAFDGSHVSEDALEYALDSFGEEHEFTVAHVAVPDIEWGGYYESWETAAERGEAILERAEELAEEHGIDLRTELLEDESAADALTILAAEKGFDTLVVGHRGTTERRRKVLGSVAEDVMDDSPPGTTVIVVRPSKKA